MSATTITLRLGSDIDYVAGTVNGEAKIYEQDVLAPEYWWTTADASVDGFYDIHVEVYKNKELLTTYDTTIKYDGITFIFNRTQEDVDTAVTLHKKKWSEMTEGEKRMFTKGMKGALNTYDLLRIENNIHAIAEMLGLSDQVVDYKDNIPEIPRESYFQGLIGRVDILRNAGYIYSNTPDVPSMPINTYQKVNDIEHILHDVYEMFKNNFHYYAGEGLYCGESTNLLI